MRSFPLLPGILQIRKKRQTILYELYCLKITPAHTEPDTLTMSIEGTAAGEESEGGEKDEEESMTAATSSARGGGAQAGQSLRQNPLHGCPSFSFSLRPKVQC
jgi:hypothetical protein